MPLDSDVAALLESFGPNDPDSLLPTDDSDEERARALKALRRISRRPVATDDQVEAKDDLTDGGIRLRIYQTDRQGVLPIIIFFHGGGWVLGDLDMHDHLCREIARDGFVVVSVDYRLAPEHRFPSAIEDAVEALGWVVIQANALRGDPTQIVVMGTSAGGNIAAALALMDANCGAKHIALQVLGYPVLDSRQDSPSYSEYASGMYLTARQMSWFWDQYAPSPHDRVNPLASPAHAQSLKGLPPAIIVTAEFDVLRDEGERYAQRLASEGVYVEHTTVPGVIHGFLAMSPQIAAAKPALNELLGRTRALLLKASPDS